MEQIVIGPTEVSRLYTLGEDFALSGVSVHLRPGRYELDRSIVLPSNSCLLGDQSDPPTLWLRPGANCHVITNRNHAQGDTGIDVCNVEIQGNGHLQQRPPDHRPLTFSCAIYFKGVSQSRIAGVTVNDIAQTALQLHTCEGVHVTSLVANRAGWSGMGTTNSSSISVIDMTVREAGVLELHSGVHFDGGKGISFAGEIAGATGNGFMLDSASGPLEMCEVKVRVSGCYRGVSLSGSKVHALSSVLIQGEMVDNVHAGLMISNADNVVVADAVISGNTEHGLLLQGAVGARWALIASSVSLFDNGSDLTVLHGSHDNWAFSTDPELSGSLDRTR